MRIHKHILVLLLVASFLLGLAACASTQGEPPEHNQAPVSLSQPQTLAATEGAASNLPFTDVPADADYVQAVEWCYEKGLMQGTSATKFAPNATLTRAMVVTVLYRWAGQPSLDDEILGYPFADVDASAWYGSAVYWARLNGVVQGYGDDRFGTEDPITNEQLDIILRRYNGEDPIWTGDPALNVPATRAEAAVAFYENLSGAAAPGSGNSPTESGDPVVYMTTDISPEGLMAVYEALNWTPTGNVAVKLSTGEPPASNYLRPELIKDVIQAVDGTIVECNTAYSGSRASTAMHYQVARDHGFNDIADVVILDENGSMTLPVTGGTVLSENYVGEHFADYDSYLVLSHFKGHSMAGFGGAIKNISIGLGSSEGKCWIHSGGTSRTNAWGGEQTAFTEAMAEAGKSVSDYLDNGDRIVYINVMNRLSVDCDCNGNPAEPDMHDIGILASTDPVALDQACVDLIYAQKDGDGASLVRRIESRNGLHTLEHAEAIGLGSRTYKLESIDEQESNSSTSEGDAVTEDNPEISSVYMTTEMTPEALIRLYDALKITLPESITVRTAMDDYHLSPELVGGLAQHLNATISECTSVAGGSASAPVHYQMAKDIGFADYAPIDIMDENGSLSLPVTNGVHLSENLVGNNMENYESMVLMTRFVNYVEGIYVGNKVIFHELCMGEIKEESRRQFQRIINSLKEKGAEGVILGCTEIGLLIQQFDSSLPVYDTTVIHAKRAAELALEPIS